MKKKKCKCYNCKLEGFNIDFIPFTTENKKVCYFCTDECKEYTINTNYNQLQVYYLIIEVINSNVPKSTQTYILNQLKNYKEVELEIIKNYLLERKSYLIDFLETKDFKNKTMKAKYIFTILIDNLEKEKKRLVNQEKRLQIEEQSLLFFEMEELSSTHIKQNHDISQFLN